MTSGCRTARPSARTWRCGTARAGTGYKVHIWQTCHEPDAAGRRPAPNLITNTETTPAPVTDVEMTEPVHHALARRGLPPGEHAADSGYASGALLLAARARGITLLTPLLEHPGFGGDSILPRCSGLSGRCLPRYRRLAEPRSDHFPLIVLSNICPAALAGCPAWWRAPARQAPRRGSGISSSGTRFAPRVPRAG